MTQFIQDKNSCAQAFLWAFRADTLKEQVRWYEALCRQAVRSYGRYVEACQKTALGLSGRARRLFEDSLLLQADILHGCYEGALEVCQSLLCALAEITWAVFTMQERRRNYTEIQMGGCVPESMENGMAFTKMSARPISSRAAGSHRP